MPTFSVNLARFSPYPNFRFLVYFGTSTTPVAAVQKVSGLKRKTDVISYKQGGDPIERKSMGRTSYDPISLDRGLTHDTEFEQWANAAQVLDTGSPVQSLKDLRRNVRLVFHNEAGQPVQAYIIYRCWVSEYTALPDLDGGGNSVAIEHIKLENEGWERDLTVGEPTEI